MKIRIAHLYYDLMNLYGEQGNILALRKAFKMQKRDTSVAFLSINDKINFNKYDFFYIGSGSDENLLLVLEDIKKYKEDIKKAIENNKYFIATGNAFELFGKFIEMNNQKYIALDIFDYYAKENPKRIVGESFVTFKDLKPIIGFQNRSSVVINDNNHLFKVIQGYADKADSKYEGYHEYNFMGTHLFGPLLIRNPHLTDYIIKDFLKKAYKNIKPSIEYDAYNEYLKNFRAKS